MWKMSSPAAVWVAGYGALQLWWAAGHAPSFGVLGTDLLLGPPAVTAALCALAVPVAVLQGRGHWHRAVAVTGWLVAVALGLSSALLLLDVVGLLLPGLHLPFDLAAFLSRSAALVGALLLAASALTYRRRREGACARCGRLAGPPKPDGLPDWARWAAYAAAASCVVRVLAQVAVGWGGFPDGARTATILFELGFALAGIVLPLALVQRWGRRIPAWLLLAPAGAIAAGLVGYFGIGTGQLAVETATGTWTGEGGLPLAFYWVAMPAYLFWGLGLGAAVLGRYRQVRRACSVCGR